MDAIFSLTTKLASRHWQKDACIVYVAKTALQVRVNPINMLKSVILNGIGGNRLEQCAICTNRGLDRFSSSSIIPET